MPNKQVLLKTSTILSASTLNKIAKSLVNFTTPLTNSIVLPFLKSPITNIVYRFTINNNIVNPVLSCFAFTYKGIRYRVSYAFAKIKTYTNALGTHTKHGLCATLNLYCPNTNTYYNGNYCSITNKVWQWQALHNGTNKAVTFNGKLPLTLVQYQ